MRIGENGRKPFSLYLIVLGEKFRSIKRVLIPLFVFRASANCIIPIEMSTIVHINQINYLNHQKRYRRYPVFVNFLETNSMNVRLDGVGELPENR